MRIFTPQDAAMSPDGSGGGNPSTPVISSSFDQTFTVNADIATAFAQFWAASSPNFLAGAYYLTMYAEIYNTTLNAGCSLIGFTLQWTVNGGLGTTTLSLPLDVPSATINYGAFLIDNGLPVEWNYAVGGWVSGVGTLRLKASLIRLA